MNEEKAPAPAQTIMDDLFKALLLMHRYKAKYLWRYYSRAAADIVTLVAREEDIFSMVRGGYPDGYCRGFFISPASLARLNALPEQEKDTLKFLDLWPAEGEAA